jgi:hypothetical protein
MTPNANASWQNDSDGVKKIWASLFTVVDGYLPGGLETLAAEE